MNKQSVAKLFRTVKLKASKHSPEILTGLGIAGMVSTTILAVQGTPKALALIEEEKLRRYKEEDDDTLSRIDIVKTAWKPYIPAMVTGTVSIACLIGANSVNTKRMAALTAAYQLSETALTEYKEKVVETIGEKKEQAVRDKVSKAKLEKHPVEKAEIIETQKGTTRCFEPMSGRYFKSNIDIIKRAENTLNERMLHDICGCASLNELYDELGLDHIDVGDMIGWNVDELIKIGIGSHVASDGEPAVVMEYHTMPRYNYQY